MEIPCYDVDASMRLKPSAFMDMAQEIAYQAANAFKFGYDELQAEGKAWVLSRLHFHYDGNPVWRDRVNLFSWHKGPAGPFYMRDFSLQGENGESLVRGTSGWVILDVKERRMCRTSEVMDMVPEGSVCTDNAIAEPVMRVVMPRGAEPAKVAVHKVEYSDVDLLGHTNNVRYVVWSMDCMEYERASRPVTDVKIAFNHETVAGEEVHLYKYECVEDSKDVCYVEGKSGDRSAFCVRIEF